MKRTPAVLTGVAFCMACAAVALAEYAVWDEGTWPKTWPAELEPLRGQARTLEGSQVQRLHYEIPFTTREEFETAWPHILKVKSEGRPSSSCAPDKRLGTPINAGVRVYAPPRREGDEDGDAAAPSPKPLPDDRPVRSRWLYSTFIELVVDGDIVDLNRIPLPADTPIVDERFQRADDKASSRGGGAARCEPNG